jgi:peptidoglycan/xylan/chitin deacetylase (PgdA/CDA1 family)
LNNSISFYAVVVFTVIELMLVIIAFGISLPINNTTYAQQHELSDTNTNSSKVVILTFGDTHKSQYTAAKPILDDYGFKASFFITCSYADDQKKTRHLSWNDIIALQEDGQDIESKGMTPVNLNNVSSKALDFETANSKQCLENHGVNSPNIFAAKYGNVWNNQTVIDAISK